MVKQKNILFFVNIKTDLPNILHKTLVKKFHFIALNGSNLRLNLLKF